MYPYHVLELIDRHSSFGQMMGRCRCTTGAKRLGMFWVMITCPTKGAKDDAPPLMRSVLAMMYVFGIDQIGI